MILTREGDALPNLWERARLANEKKSDVFISVHHNAGIGVSEKTARGTETYYKVGSQEWGLWVAVHQAVVSALGTVDRGVRPNPNYVVLKEAAVPAVLVEVAFLTHPGRRAYQGRVVQAPRGGRHIQRLVEVLPPLGPLGWNPSEAGAEASGWRSLQAAEAEGGAR